MQNVEWLKVNGAQNISLVFLMGVFSEHIGCVQTAVSERSWNKGPARTRAGGQDLRNGRSVSVTGGGAVRASAGTARQGEQPGGARKPGGSAGPAILLLGAVTGLPLAGVT